MTTALATRDNLVREINSIVSEFRVCRRAFAFGDDESLAFHRGNIMSHLKNLGVC